MQKTQPQLTAHSDLKPSDISIRGDWLKAGRLIAIASQSTASIERRFSNVLEQGWPAYLLILLLQIKVVWRMWELRDITLGDTAQYFTAALAWNRGYHFDIVWSPLYAAFYGSFLFATSDPYNITILHRIVIVLAAAVGVLFVLRQILSPGLALLGAAWWAVLPINYDTLYEVHLFALLPILLAWALILSSSTAWARAAALVIVASGAVLVRNEFLVAALVMALMCAAYERRFSQKPAHCLFTYGAALTVAAAVCGLAYWRSIIKFPELWSHFQDRHALNMCQAFAFGYQQRNVAWTKSPWLDCQGLAQQVFGAELPSIGQMLWSNPKAVLAHFAWNIGLLPNGLEALLFNAMGGGLQPDYVPTKIALYPVVLGALVIVLLAATAVLALRARPNPWSWISSRATLAFLPFLIMSVPVVFTQRPRPSYLLYLSVILIAAVLWGIYRLLQRRPGLLRALDAGAFAVVIALILLLPRYSIPTYLPSGRPILAKLADLSPHRALLIAPHGRIILGNWAPELLYYLDINLSRGYPLEGPRVVFDNALLRSRDGTTALEEFLAQQQVTVLYLDPGELQWLRALPQARNMLEHPRMAGWRDVARSEEGERSWLLLAKMQLPASPAD
jgi:hypothetical protein